MYSILKKGASRNPNETLHNGAVITSALLSILVITNLMTVVIIFIDSGLLDLNKNSYWGGSISLILMVLNFYYFLSGKKYLELHEIIMNKSKSDRKRYNIFVILYYVLTFLCFIFVLLFL
jgi:hypothetical protein